MADPDFKIVEVPVLDTGLGREAGYANDAELIEAAKAMRTEIDDMLSPEGRALLEAAERELERKLIFGSQCASHGCCSARQPGHEQA